MLIKLQEAQKLGTTHLDTHGRTVSDSKFVFRELLINPDHVVSVNEDVEATRNSGGQTLSRLETTRGVFTVLGTPSEIESKFGTRKASQKILKD